MDIHADNLDKFWLTGKSRISQVEEIDFLRRIYSGDVPFSQRSRDILKKVMLIDNKPTYKLYGKTGWATNVDSVTVSGPNIGWFVGYVEKGDNVYFFCDQRGATHAHARHLRTGPSADYRGYFERAGHSLNALHRTQLPIESLV